MTDLAPASGLMALFRPGEAGRKIGIKPSTLRVYCQRFADLLADGAAGADRPGHRLFTDRDVAMLQRAHELLDRGFTYEQTAAELRGAGFGTRGAATVRRTRATRAAAPDASHVGQLAILEQAVQAWRALAEERATEIAALRDELRQQLRAADRPPPRFRRH